MVDYSDGYIGNYSAQQAQTDYRKNGEETVRFSVIIPLTDSYGQFVPISAHSAFVPGPRDFWKDFKVQVYTSEGPLSPPASLGHAKSSCGRAWLCLDRRND